MSADSCELPQRIRFASPRLRGEADARSAAGEGTLHESTYCGAVIVEAGPSPEPSPRKNGERESESERKDFTP